MKKVVSALSAALIIAALVVGPVLAASPHFVKASSSVNDSGQLVISWKEAGLDDTTLVAYEASADSIATWGCINGGGKHPQAANKETVAGPVSTSGTFSSGKNGQITASLVFGPIPATVNFSCPPGQRLMLLEVSYTAIVLTDTTNGISITLPDASHIFFR
jgi:hypothetical protein